MENRLKKNEAIYEGKNNCSRSLSANGDWLRDGFRKPGNDCRLPSTSALNTDATAVHSGGSEAMAVNPEGSVARSDQLPR